MMQKKRAGRPDERSEVDPPDHGGISPPNSSPSASRLVTERSPDCKQMGFSLRVNHRASGGWHPDRDAQVSQIAKLRVRCAAKCLPVISVDTKKERNWLRAR